MRGTSLTSRSGKNGIVRNRRKRIVTQAGRRCKDAAAVPECAKLQISDKKKLLDFFHDILNVTILASYVRPLSRM